MDFGFNDFVSRMEFVFTDLTINIGIDMDMYQVLIL